EVADAVAPRMKEGSCREMLDVTAALQLHSIKRRSRCTAVFPGVSVLSKPTPAPSKCLKLKCRVTSQAGRRGFESRLPLHLSNNLESPTSSCFTSFTLKSGFCERFRFVFPVCRFATS